MNDASPTDARQEALSTPRMRLAAWQAQRLESTYADLRASERYAPATAFFLQDLYGPTDFTKRDRDAERVVSKMRRILPERAMAAIESAMHLNKLSLTLDEETAAMLFTTMGVEVVDGASCAEAYRRCDYRSRRIEQIALIEELGMELDVVVKKPLVQMALKLARGPAHLAGLGELQEFLERGVSAFLHMKGAEHFLHTIVHRERQILDAIYAGVDDPFTLDLDP
ncbi:MAG: hypothetical protein JO218_00340 [Burkholderiales bacterium]|nr:hypothetical protein [Burkholderiales bacterium]